MLILLVKSSNNLPIIYWVPNPPKVPTKFGFIMASPISSLNPLTKSVTSFLKLLYDQIKSFSISQAGIENCQEAFAGTFAFCYVFYYTLDYITVNHFIVAFFDLLTMGCPAQMILHCGTILNNGLESV